MRAKPDMEPWVNTDKSGLSSFRSGTNSASICLTSRKCRPYGAQKNVYQCLTQGLRPYRARFGECVVKIGMEEGEYCVDTALLCNGLVFSLVVEGVEECL